MEEDLASLDHDLEVINLQIGIITGIAAMLLVIAIILTYQIYKLKNKRDEDEESTDPE